MIDTEIEIIWTKMGKKRKRRKEREREIKEDKLRTNNSFFRPKIESQDC